MKTNAFFPVLCTVVLAASSCSFDPTTVTTEAALQNDIDTETYLGQGDIIDSSATSFSSGDNYNSNWARASWNNIYTIKETVASNPLLGTLSMRIIENIEGDFIVAPDLNSIWNTTNTALKHFATTRIQNASFIKVNGAWQLDRFAPLSEARTLGAGVNILQARIYAPTNASSPTATFSNSDLSNLILGSGLSRITNFQWARVEVDVSAASGIVALAYARHNNTRYPLYDTGTRGDRTAGDNTFSGNVWINGSTLKHVIFDVLDNATVTNTNNNVYAAAVWDVLLTSAVQTDNTSLR